MLQCPILNDPQNGMVTVPDRSANSVATYTCNPGFRLEGNEERVCDARTGDWTGNAPMCICEYAIMLLLIFSSLILHIYIYDYALDKQHAICVCPCVRFFVCCFLYP